MNNKLQMMIQKYLLVLEGRSKIYKYIVVFIICCIIPTVALLVSQVSRLIYKDKFNVVNSAYECGFSNDCKKIEYYNELACVIPKFIILEICFALIIFAYYLYGSKITVNIILIILSILSVYFSKTLDKSSLCPKQ